MGLNREILRLSVPAIVSNVTVPLLGLCDTGISGHLGSEVYLAAISVGSMMLSVVFWLFGFLRMGTTGLTATAFGAGDAAGCRDVFTRSFALALAAGAILTTVQGPLMRVLLLFVSPGPEVAPLVERYFGICILEAPALLGTLAVSGWFVGMQNTVWPMAIAIGVNVVNIAASLLLVFRFGMGFEGVALGTLSANWLGLAAALGAVAFFTRKRGGFWNWRALREWKGPGNFFSVNASLFFRSFFITAVTLGVTAAGARLGAMTLAVNAVLMQFYTLFSFFMDGFAFSGEALTGRFQGAGNRGMARRSHKALLGWAFGMGVFFTLAYVSGITGMASLLTDEECVRAGVRAMWPWIAALPLVSVWAFIYDGFFVGALATSRMLWATMAASIVFYMTVFGPWHWPVEWGNRILWSAFLCYLGLRGAILMVQWPAVERSRFKEK